MAKIEKGSLGKHTPLEVANRLQSGQGKEGAYRIAVERYGSIALLTDGDLNPQFFRRGEPLKAARFWQQVVGILKKRQPALKEAEA